MLKFIMSHTVCDKTLKEPYIKNYVQLVNLQLINNDVWRPELRCGERNLGDAVTLIRVPNQKLMSPVLQRNKMNQKSFFCLDIS